MVGRVEPEQGIHALCGVPDVIRVGLVALAEVDAFLGLRVEPGRISQQQDRTDSGLQQQTHDA